MTQYSSYTADVTSDVVKRLGTALDKAGKSINTRRAKELQEIQKRIGNLRSRGLLKKQEYVSVSTAEFERRYYNADHA
jgi:hypothetical protein